MRSFSSLLIEYPEKVLISLLKRVNFRYGIAAMKFTKLNFSGFSH